MAYQFKNYSDEIRNFVKTKQELIVVLRYIFSRFIAILTIAIAFPVAGYIVTFNDDVLSEKFLVEGWKVFYLTGVFLLISMYSTYKLLRFFKF